MDHHQKAVEDISKSVKRYYERQEKFRIFHGSTNSTRPFAAKGSRLVDTSKLSHVLKVDTEKRTALVEPNVPMDRLVEETLKYGLVPPVVMEFPGITAGGGYAGTSGESSSFKHGFFDCTINYVEMVLANGEVVTCSDSEKADLFHGAAGAVGSLGITTLIELQLREAKKYVETTYHPVSSISEAIEKIQAAASDSELDYVDGILFSKSQGAIITGRMTDNPVRDVAIQRFSDANDPWFYLHVRDLISQRTGPTTEAIPLAEYLFRYDRGGFWVGASAFEYFGMPFNSYTRWFLDDFLHTRMMYTALHASGQSKKYVVQDLALPYSTAGEFIEYTNDAFGIWPLWLCPLRPSPQPTMHPHSRVDPLEPLLNIGLWGYGPSKHDDFVALNRDLERKLREFGGMKWLYAHTYYTGEEFWEMFNREWYDALREKYHATSLPSVYEKVKIDVAAEKQAAEATGLNSLLTMWPISGFYGIRKAIESGTYLQARNSSWKASTTDRFGMARK
jgi:delta24-sterol reductase